MSFSDLSKGSIQNITHHSQFQNLDESGQSERFDDRSRQENSLHQYQYSIKDSEENLGSNTQRITKVLIFILCTLAAVTLGLFLYQRFQQITISLEKIDETLTKNTEDRIKEAEKSLQARLQAYKVELQHEMISLKAIERQKLIKELKDQIRAQIKQDLLLLTRNYTNQAPKAEFSSQATSNIKESLRKDLYQSLKQQITTNLRQEFKVANSGLSKEILSNQLNHTLAQNLQDSENQLSPPPTNDNSNTLSQNQQDSGNQLTPLPVDELNDKEGLQETTRIQRKETSPTIFQYPTVGIPEPGKTFNSTPVGPEDLAIFDQTINDLFKPYNDTDCGMIKVGAVMNTEKGYLLCGNHLSQVQGLLNLGIQGNDEFGCQFSTSFQVRNYVYDCQLQNAPICGSSNNRQFYSICLGEVTQKKDQITYYNLEDVLKNRNLQSKHIILKIDKPGYQFSTFRNFPLKMLENIDQIIMQVHLGEAFSQVWGNLDIMKTLSESFIPVNYHMNEDVCYELTPEKARLRRVKARAFQVTLIKKDLLKLRSNTRSYKKHPLYRANRCSPKLECQMQP